MKPSNSFKTFLLTLESDDITENEKTKGLSLAEAADVYARDCEWLDINKPLYRWVNKEPGGIAVRETRERNYTPRRELSKFISSHGWDKFPDRSKSVFTSTTKKVAPGLASPRSLLVLIYPFKNLELGITKDMDYNYTYVFDGTEYACNFATLERRILSFATTIVGKQTDLQRAAKIIKNTSEQAYYDAYLKKFDIEETEDGNDVAAVAEITKMATEKFKFYKEHIEGALTPLALGFKLKSSSTFIMPKTTHEVWFEGKYLAIPSDQHKAFINEVNKSTK